MMARVKFPKGVRSVSISGVSIPVDKDGIADVPPTAIPMLKESFGAKDAPEEKAANTGGQTGGGTT
jgi:hypothetical protein